MVTFKVFMLKPGAGYWGDYRNCDVPVWTVESMFDYIANNEKVNENLHIWNKNLKFFFEFDYVYWTGDLP